MWQLLGLGCFLSALAAVQLIWPWPLPGLNTAPALLLLAGSLILYRRPLNSLYACLLLLAAGFDLLLGEGPYCLITYALALALPMLLPKQRQGWFSAIGWMLASVLSFDLLMLLINGIRGAGALNLFIQHFLPSLAYHLLAAILLQPVTDGLISLLHYQRFEYHKDVMKGRLG
jgi:hypothetical protein